MEMADYINREALLAHIKDLPTWWADAGGVYGSSMKYPEGMFDCEDVVSLVENAPAAKVAPVRHGHWIETVTVTGSRCFECSNCGAIENEHTAIKGYYCWRCGAKMDEGVQCTS